MRQGPDDLMVIYVAQVFQSVKEKRKTNISNMLFFSYYVTQINVNEVLSTDFRIKLHF